MTQFEQELIKAIEHGCPLCNRREFYLTHIVTVAREYPSKDIVLHEGREVEVRSLCGAVLYDWDDGWIPELQFVKGE